LTALGGTVLVLTLSLAGCGQKGPLYLGKPPPPHPVRNAGASDDAAGNVVNMSGAVDMSIAPSSGPDRNGGAAASDSK